MTDNSFKRIKHACYFANGAMTAVFGLPPLLFATFQELYGISYTLLGTLVLTNFLTQLGVDLIFTFFSKHFSVAKAVRTMPFLTAAGFLVYALIPTLFPEYAYVGLLIGTVIFSVSAGLGEVLISPIVAAIPSDTPEKDMSILHSLYAYGLLAVICISTLLLKLFGNKSWMLIAMLWAIPSLVSGLLLCSSQIPEVSNAPNQGGSGRKVGKGLALCGICIFLGSAAENTMTNWSSSYIEKALNLDKVWGDIFGMGMFALLLGLARTWYAKYGKNIFRVLFLGMAGAVVCYVVTGLCPFPVISVSACFLAGLCTSMLWPGTLILMEERFPGLGVAAYALMASSGDFGASVAPQMLGVVVDTVAAGDFAAALGAKLSLTQDQVGLRAGMLLTALFPILGLIVLAVIKRYFDRLEREPK